jgi:molecular chaperone GrpE
MSDPRKIRIVTEEEEYSRTPQNTGTEDNRSEAGSGSEEPHDSASAPDDGLKEMKARLEAKEKEHKDIYDRLLRTTAEFENYKKRAARDIEEFRKYANQSLLKEMLSVVDHIELAIQAASAKTGADKSLLDGLSLTHKELLRILEKFNVTPIDAVGQPFNPEFHEAILRETSDQVPENTVLREMQKGYLINSRLLRPSLVVVASPKPKDTLSETMRDIDTVL